jgi:hypothetical protein
MMLDTLQGWLCCDNPDLVAICFPGHESLVKVACRACGKIEDEDTSPKPPHADVVVAAELPLIA